MNNDLEQFSEERLKKICDFTKGGVDVRHVEIEALARIALAAKQAKPVYQIETYLINEEDKEVWSWDDADYARYGKHNENHRRVLYTTPQPAHTEQDGWIKCSERMPDEEGMYQCWGKFFANDEYGYFCSSYRPHIKPMWVPVEDDCDPIDVSVTHWMPLPAAPKPESE